MPLQGVEASPPVLVTLVSVDNPRPDASFGTEPVPGRPPDAVDPSAAGTPADNGSAAAVPPGHDLGPDPARHPAADPVPAEAQRVAGGASPGAESSEGGDASAPPHAAPGGSSLFGYIALYTLLRVALVVALTAVLMIFMPLIVALMFAIIVQLPLSWVLFAGPRRRVNEAIAQASQRRRAERARLQSALRGDDSQD